MADTSSYSIEERLVASVWVHDRQHTGQTMSQVMAAFRERFNKDPPRRATLLDWEKERSLLEVLKAAEWEKNNALGKVQRLPLPLNVPQ